jgi:hypothetical protein
MTKAFLVAMIVLTFAAFGVVNYKITQDAISVEDEAGKIYPAALSRTLPGRTADKIESAEPDIAAPAGEIQGTSDTCLGMGYDEAKALALAGACGQEGGLLDAHYCNEGTKTWWIDMDVQKSGCSPACVVNVETKTSEINWRCTGALPGAGNPAPTSK